MIAAFESADLHVDEHTLDLYVLGHLAPSKAAFVRKHILICDSCCSSLCDTVEFIDAIRTALRARHGCTAVLIAEG